jgi:mannitol/fructose-specific phosphotransferase system IIA component (Ntr-type)
MHITALLSPSTIQVATPASDKAAAIDRTLDLLKDSPLVADLDQVRRVVIERENYMSTGVGKGLGLPHGKTTGMKGSAAALSVLAQPVDFDAFDGEPVGIVFLLVGPPEAHTLHIRTLSRISRLMNQAGTRNAVLQAQTPEEVYGVIERAESALLEAEGIQ